jgi:hypothetical protein
MIRVTRRQWKLATYALIIVCGLLLAGLIVAAAMDKKINVGGSILLIVLGLVAIVAALASGSSETLDWRNARRWLRPQTAAALFMAFCGAFGLLTDALSLLEPRNPQEANPGEIRNGIKRIESRLDTVPGLAAAPPPARIGAAIIGLWGEPGCAVAMRIALHDKAIVAEFIRRPADIPPYRFEATVVAKEGDVMTVRGEAPETARGQVATFTYWTNGRQEQLTWDDRVHSPPAVFERCPET